MVLFLQYLPHSYCNELYSSALHLGLWKQATEQFFTHQNNQPVGSNALGVAPFALNEEKNEMNPVMKLVSAICLILRPDFISFQATSDADVALSLQARKAGYSELVSS